MIKSSSLKVKSIDSQIFFFLLFFQESQVIREQVLKYLNSKYFGTKEDSCTVFDMVKIIQKFLISFLQVFPYLNRFERVLYETVNCYIHLFNNQTVKNTREVSPLSRKFNLFNVTESEISYFVLRVVGIIEVLRKC